MDSAFYDLNAEGMWPRIGSEPHPWAPAPEGISRTSFSAHSGPYLAAVTPRIANQELALPSHVQALAAEAASELARADAVLVATGIAPLPAVLLRTESASSSQIERLTASARSLAEAELGEPTGDNARMVVANVRAMERALIHVGPITLESLLQVHDTLIEPDRDHFAGLREEQVWVGGTNVGPHRANFIAPHQRRVPKAMTDLVEFTHRQDLPVVAHMAIAHAQFETIHPFTDGNGRTGRALIHMMLREARLTRGATIPVSAGLLHETDDYFAALEAYRDGDPEQIVVRVAEAAIFAARASMVLSNRLVEIRDGWRSRIRARKGATAFSLAEILPSNPVITYEVVLRQLGVAAPTAYVAINTLEEAGVLKPRSSNKRNRIWDAVDVLDALDNFAESARRR